VIEMEMKEKLKLKKLLAELQAIRGRHTELVSVYIPSEFNLQEIVNMLRQEISLTQNVKDKTVRRNVTSALEKIIHELGLIKRTPPNGLAIFCGNVSDKEGVTDIKLWTFEPPEKITHKIYWCDQTFALNILRDMIEEKEIYGLIVLYAKEANIGMLKGKTIQSIKNLDSTVPSKTVKGGMSQGRYDRLREDAINEFLTKVGDSASEIFLQHPEIKGIIIGGPGPIKERFVKDEYLNYQVQKKILGVKDIGYTGEYGLEELAKRSEDLLQQTALVKERDLLTKFFTEIQKDGLVVYGKENTKKALEAGTVSVLLISENLDQIMTEEFVEKAESFGTKIEFISQETNEGKQFEKLGGVGGMLRYKNY